MGARGARGRLNAGGRARRTVARPAAAPSAPGRRFAWPVWALRLVARARRLTPVRFLSGYLVDCQGADLAAGIAFHTLLYLFPLVGALLTIVGVVLQDERRLALVSVMIVQVFPAESWRESLQGLVAARENAGLVGIVSVVGLFWLGSGMIASLARAFNQIYRAPNRDLFRQRVFSFGFIVVVALLLIVSAGAASATRLIVHAVQHFLGLRPLGWGLTGTALGLGTGLATAFVLFLLVYWTVPNVRLRFRDVWPGAAFAAVAFVAATQLFPLYARLAPTNRYGAALGLIFLLTTWCYLLAHILLLGNALNAFRRSDRTGQGTTC
jgi:membrane protein